MLTQMLRLACIVAVLSAARVNSKIDFIAIAGVVSGFAAAITAWQSENGANRKINRYTNAVVALKNRACKFLPPYASCCTTALSSIDR